jgi:hypothetical protein
MPGAIMFVKALDFAAGNAGGRGVLRNVLSKSAHGVVRLFETFNLDSVISNAGKPAAARLYTAKRCGRSAARR